MVEMEGGGIRKESPPIGCSYESLMYPLDVKNDTMGMSTP